MSDRDMYELAKFGVGVGIFGLVILAITIFGTVLGWS